MRINPWLVAGGVGAVLLFLSRKSVAAVGSAVVAGVKEDIKIRNIVAAAEVYKIPAAMALAVADVESGGGSGFAKDGKLIIRFEPHIFRDQTKELTGAVIEPPPLKRGGQAAEWEMLNAAIALNRDAALRATSWGMFQTMGFNHKSAGYPTVQAMIDAYAADQNNQIQGFFKFCSVVKGNEYKDAPMMLLSEAARTGNFLAFARGYNGKGQKGYDNLIKKRYDVWVSRGYKGIGS